MNWRKLPTQPCPPRTHRDYLAVVEPVGTEKAEEIDAIRRLMRAHGFEYELPDIGGRTLAPFKNMFMLKRSVLSMDTVRTLVTTIFEKTPYQVRWFIAEVTNTHWSPQ